MMLREPVTMIAQRVATARELERLADRGVLRFSLRRRRLIEHGQSHDERQPSRSPTLRFTSFAKSAALIFAPSPRILFTVSVPPLSATVISSAPIPVTCPAETELPPDSSRASKMRTTFPCQLVCATGWVSQPRARLAT